MTISKIDPAGLDIGQIGGRRNLIINGASNVWQRSTSATLSSAGTYITNDRWKYWASGATLSSARTAFTVGQTDVPNFEYYNRIVVGANSGAGDYATFNQHVEDVIQADAQTFTLSFYAKASQSWTIGIEPLQNFGSGGSSRVLGSPQNVTVGTSWTRHTVTFTTASISGKTLGTGHNFELAFWISGGSDFNARTGSIGNNAGTFDITGVQLEVGTVATPFEHRSYGEELALCQRYYHRYINGTSQFIGIGSWWVASAIDTGVTFPVAMRSAPTLVATSGSNYYYMLTAGNARYISGSFSLGRATTNACQLAASPDVGDTAGRAGQVASTSASSSIAFDAEL